MSTTVNWNKFGLYTRPFPKDEFAKHAPRLKAIMVRVVCKLSDEPRTLIKFNNRSETWVENTKLEFLDGDKAIYRPA